MPSRLYGTHILLRSNHKSSPARRLSRCSGLAAHARAWFAPFDPQTGCRNAQSMSTPSKRVDGARTAREIHGNGIHRRVYHAPGDPHDGAVLRRRLVTVSWGFRVECVVSPSRRKTSPQRIAMGARLPLGREHFVGASMSSPRSFLLSNGRERARST